MPDQTVVAAPKADEAAAARAAGLRRDLTSFSDKLMKDIRDLPIVDKEKFELSLKVVDVQNNFVAAPDDGAREAQLGELRKIWGEVMLKRAEIIAGKLGKIKLEFPDRFMGQVRERLAGIAEDGYREEDMKDFEAYLADGEKLAGTR